MPITSAIFGNLISWGLPSVCLTGILQEMSHMACP
ncbi:hypothetical protein M2137_001964 [Parabacteroides sp. PFB2-10]|nr:hypothetical protein [Parabacteroides sp. PFB2-10]